ncbi:phospholipase/carboxylesterase [Marinobacter sp. DSM 26671]|uniref:Carboxylesterase n=1 Tax=Marinobacter manganoxydans MnI7-9 TaxID=1094979 RepID=G6YNG9_9GAMM|nr:MULTISPECIES: alpha/beta fold hydrolase [Marinobacter]MAK48305.1 carboxylesterase [Marinobacter sp.]MCK5865869.1 alpha/beta fold hydrolase [Marinobacter adhaerens]MCP4062718.1 alpha/beta fold hydrolase [Gammaproteobacteria bacterium]MCR9188753.1 alpha/beta hydrolase [Alteromonadaceae bacterium]MEC7727806.1 alpha/beta fold hydrolase [Pseudomonadota bacterium]
MQDLQYIEIETGENPTAAVIWLHGLGASGHDFEPVVPELGLPEDTAVRFIFPHAPNLPVTINGGMSMPAWYDIKAMDIDRVVDTEQLRASADAVAKLVEQQKHKGIPPERIIIAGFSQGGAVAYELGLSYPERFGGVLALSTYFATADTVERSEANADVPISVYHGTFDPMVPESLGVRSVETLKEMGYDPSYQTFPMEHSVCLEEIQDIGRFIRRHLL